jgi:GNAT superfamily N-acetyltransferase
MHFNALFLHRQKFFLPGLELQFPQLPGNSILTWPKIGPAQFKFYQLVPKRHDFSPALLFTNSVFSLPLKRILNKHKLPIQTNFIEELHEQIQFELDDTQNVMQQFGLTPIDVLNLCGGIPLPIISSINVNISSQYSGALTAHVATDQYEVIRTIDMDIRRIDNRSMVVDQEARGMGIGTNLFLNQIKEARQRHFVKLQTFTRAPSLYDDEDQDWQGYYFWANFGFINTEVEEFNQWAAARGRHELSLTELMQTEEGRNLWRQHGYSWIGDFILEEGHACSTFLTAYLNRKGIDWQ